MKKNYYIVGAGLLLLYLFLKNKKAKQPIEQLATDQNTQAAQDVATVESFEPLLVSPSQQQQINQYTPGMNDRGQNITVRYVAGMKKHYI